MRRKDKERIEPTTSLIDTLRDEIGRELVGKLLLVLERIVL
jgi:hypothetical protein